MEVVGWHRWWRRASVARSHCIRIRLASLNSPFFDSGEKGGEEEIPTMPDPETSHGIFFPPTPFSLKLRNTRVYELKLMSKSVRTQGIMQERFGPNTMNDPAWRETGVDYLTGEDKRRCYSRVSLSCMLNHSRNRRIPVKFPLQNPYHGYNRGSLRCGPHARTQS